MTTLSPQYAILFADVSGSTSLYEKLGDQRALAAVESVLTEMRKSIAMQNGRVIKTIGDEVMAVLPTADAAMHAACDMQQRITAIEPIENVRLTIRAGFHFGPAIEDNSDFFGDAVNTAGRDFEVIWHDSEDLTTMAARDKPLSTQESTLTLTYGEHSLPLGAAHPAASLGRDAANDLAIADKMASRVHCKIEHRRGKFFLVDQSTNGTYVTVEGDAEIMLKREQTMLRGRGVICLGHTSTEAGAEIVKFEVN